MHVAVNEITLGKQHAACAMCSTILGFAFQIESPPNSGRSDTKRPFSITGVRISSSFIP